MKACQEGILPKNYSEEALNDRLLSELKDHTNQIILNEMSEVEVTLKVNQGKENQDARIKDQNEDLLVRYNKEVTDIRDDPEGDQILRDAKRVLCKLKEDILLKQQNRITYRELIARQGQLLRRMRTGQISQAELASFLPCEHDQLLKHFSERLNDFSNKLLVVVERERNLPELPRKTKSSQPFRNESIEEQKIVESRSILQVRDSPSQGEISRKRTYSEYIFSNLADKEIISKLREEVTNKRKGIKRLRSKSYSSNQGADDFIIIKKPQQ